MEKFGRLFIKSFVFVIMVSGILKIAALLISGLEIYFPVQTILLGCVGFVLVFTIYKVVVLFVGAVGHRKMDSNYPFWLANQRFKQSKPHDYGFSMKPIEGRNRILTLSGGGYKAGLFHLGSLEELNAQGKLKSINAFASVSGGSITNAWLGANWTQLNFDEETQIADNFDELIFKPLFAFYTEVTIDAPAVLKGLFSARAGSWYFSESLRKHLFDDRKLSDFPDPGDNASPNFFITATDLRTNTSWRFSRLNEKNKPVEGCAVSYKHGTSTHAFFLRDVVSASAAFPPVLSPKKLALPNMKPSGSFARRLKMNNVEGRKPFEEYALLGDGGIYDNLGLERAKGYKHVLVSNAGDPFGVSPTYAADWISQIRGTIRHMHRQVEQRRKIHFGDLKAIKRINLLLWEIDDLLDPDIIEQFDGLNETHAWKVATFPVRLKRTDKTQANWIVQHARSLTRRQIELVDNWDAEPGAESSC